MLSKYFLKNIEKTKEKKYDLSKALWIYTHTHTHMYSLIENNKEVIVKYSLIYDAKKLKKSRKN
jgi:hypothetical protein